jgi:glutamate N-acetyltransferase / amino-acid N-acetyltransferase
MTLPRRSPGKIHLPHGFSFSAACAGIKASGRLDLGLVEAAPGTTAAAVFTKNRVVAAPVKVGRTSIASRGRVRAVIVNSGNANCATGNHGYVACRIICRAAGRLLGLRPEEVFPSSTGIIGVPLPTKKILVTLPTLVSGRGATRKHLDHFARAIMTTDKRPKLASMRVGLRKRHFNLLGVAKGSGMIHPQLATMLVYLFTDAVATPPDLNRLLRTACEQTFNRISVDGDTSTNDTVLLLASGQSGVRLNNKSTSQRFANALLEVCQSLAEQIVSDGEGVEHVIRLSVDQANNQEEALRVARAVAHSLLVKTAWAGADPNWGRILAAVGASGAPINPDTVSIFIGSQLVCRNGASCQFNESMAHRHLAKPVCEVRITLQRGEASTKFLTTDLTADYVRINADYST